MAGARLGKVYLIKAGPYYKIGWTYHLEKRLKAIQQAQARNLSLIHTWETRTPYEFEQFLHAKYRKFRQRGEWFKFTSKQVNGLKCIRGKEFPRAEKPPKPGELTELLALLFRQYRTNPNNTPVAYHTVYGYCGACDTPLYKGIGRLNAAPCSEHTDYWELYCDSCVKKAETKWKRKQKNLEPMQLPLVIDG